MLVTGAPDVLFRLCQYQQSDSGLQPLDLPYWEGKIEEYAREGLRMVAAAWKPAAAGQTELTHQDLQQGVILLGVAGMMDPPRPEAITAIADCLQAGIRVKMITRRPPANGDEHRQDAGDWQCGKCHYRTRAGGDGRRAAERSRAAV